MPEELNQKLQELEERLAYQEDYLSEMNKRIAEQDGEIAKLQLQLRHVNDKIKQGQDADSNIYDGIETPPHY